MTKVKRISSGKRKSNLRLRKYLGSPRVSRRRLKLLPEIVDKDDWTDEIKKAKRELRKSYEELR